MAKDRHKTKMLSQGAILLEGALASAFLFPMLLMACELLLLNIQNLALQYAITRSLRTKTIGTTATGTYSTVAEIKQEIIEQGKIFKLKIPQNQIYVCTFPSNPCDATNSTQILPQQYIKISANIDSFAIFGLFKKKLTATLIGRSE